MIQSKVIGEYLYELGDVLTSNSSKIHIQKIVVLHFSGDYYKIIPIRMKQGHTVNTLPKWEVDTFFQFSHKDEMTITLYGK